MMIDTVSIDFHALFLRKFSKPFDKEFCPENYTSSLDFPYKYFGLLWAILRENTDPSSPIIKSEKTLANLVYF
jgi:hypothetical protein